LDEYVAGTKTWEMRSSSTAFRGWFALIGSGTGMVWGIAKLVAVERPQSMTEMLATIDKHQIPQDTIRSGEVAKWDTPWVVDGVRPLRPVPSGAKGQIWANLQSDTVAAIAQALA